MRDRLDGQVLLDDLQQRHLPAGQGGRPAAQGVGRELRVDHVRPAATERMESMSWVADIDAST